MLLNFLAVGFIIFSLQIIFATQINAQVIQSNKVITKVGNPTDPMPGVGGCNTPAPQPNELRQAIKDQFNINMVGGFNNEQLRWAWEKFCEVSGTKFINLVSGVSIIFSSESKQMDNDTILIQPLLEETFKVVLTHELGHIIRRRTDSYLKRVNEAIDKEGYLTGYSNNAPRCSGSDKFNEDYAEMVAYYLNPNSSSQTVQRDVEGGCSGGPNPYAGGAKPLHYAIAKDLLGPFP